MRPFRFFFGISLAVMMFFFFARFVIMAMIVAAVLSVAFHLSRKLKYFLLNLRWEDERYYNRDFRNQYELSPGYSRRREALYHDLPKRRADFLEDYRSIEVQ